MLRKGEESFACHGKHDLGGDVLEIDIYFIEKSSGGSLKSVDVSLFLAIDVELSQDI